jgi:catechol 2,3-dioxygenase-like lactoylglutathione lyase family enzyme
MALAHVTLATRNVREAEAFFAAALGWRPIDRPNNVGRPAAWLEIAPGQELHLVEVLDFQPSPFEAEFGRHVATLIDPLRATPFLRFFFRSPDGYVFEVVPAERQPETGSCAHGETP